MIDYLPLRPGGRGDNIASVNGRIIEIIAGRGVFHNAVGGISENIRSRAKLEIILEMPLLDRERRFIKRVNAVVKDYLHFLFKDLGPVIIEVFKENFNFRENIAPDPDPDVYLIRGDGISKQVVGKMYDVVKHFISRRPRSNRR